MSFKEEILSFLRKVDSSTFELTEPHLLYLDDQHADSYLQAMKNENYSGGFHSETVDLINCHKESIFSDYKTLNLVDLGPGYPDKSLPIARWFKNRGKLNYFPVDVSPLYLKVAVSAMREFSSLVKPLNEKFENLEHSQSYPKDKNTFVMLGLTFMNFQGDFILKLLRKISGDQGHIIIATELLNQELESILEQYRIKETEELAFGPLLHLGCSKDDFCYDLRFEQGRVEMSFIAQKKGVLGNQPIRVNDRVVTAISYRYKKNEFNTLLGKYFKSYEIFDAPSKKTSLAICHC